MAYWARRGVWRRISAAELRAEVGGLDLAELADFFPGFVANGPGDVDFKLQD